MASPFQPKNTKQTYTNLQLIDYLVQTIGLDPTGANTILGLLENNNSGISPSTVYGEDGSNVPIQIGIGVVNLTGFSIYNPNNVDCFFKLLSSLGPVIGVDEPNMLFQIPALGSLTIEGGYTDIIFKNAANSGMFFAFTTGYLHTDNTAPAIDLVYSLSYH
jgi:hypothetical protein